MQNRKKNKAKSEKKRNADLFAVNLVGSYWDEKADYAVEIGSDSG